MRPWQWEPKPRHEPEPPRRDWRGYLLILAPYAMLALLDVLGI